MLAGVQGGPELELGGLLPIAPAASAGQGGETSEARRRDEVKCEIKPTALVDFGRVNLLNCCSSWILFCSGLCFRLLGTFFCYIRCDLFFVTWVCPSSLHGHCGGKPALPLSRVRSSTAARVRSFQFDFSLAALTLLLTGIEEFIPFLCFTWKETLSCGFCCCWL